MQNTSTIPLNKELACAVSYINSRYMYINVNRYIHARKLKGLLAPKGEINLTQLREDHAVELVFQNLKPSLNRCSYIYHIPKITENTTCMNVFSAKSKLKIP